MAGEYQVMKKLAAGGCAAVYLGQHPVTGARRAIKFLHRAIAAVPSMVERFAREALAANLINHPNIVRVYDFGTIADGRHYLTMDYLEGANLSELLQVRGRFHPQEVLAVIEPVCQALDAAHRVGIVHRDIKGENIFVVNVGPDQQVKLLDFGVAKLMQPDPNAPHLTVAGIALGTPSTMSPEQIRGETLDGRSDVYALGVLLYQLLTGSMPFRAATREEVTRSHLSASPPMPSQKVPGVAALDAVVARSMEKDPARRFATPMEFCEALRAVCSTVGAAPVAAEQELLGLYVGGRTVNLSEEEAEQALEDGMRVLELSSEALRGEGYSVCLETSSSHLGFKTLPEDPEERQRSKQEAIAFAVRLRRQLVQELGESPVRLVLCVHVAAGDVAETPSGLTLRGGPLAELEEWLPKNNRFVLCMTTRAAQALGHGAQGESHVPIPESPLAP